MQIRNPALLEKLQKSGFSDKEALVYLSVLELGGAFPSKIAEYSGIKRSTVYATLTTLSIRGLVNEVEKRNKLFYQIEKPEKIISHAKTRISLAEDQLERAKNIIPDIEGLYATFTNQPRVRYFEGTDGMVLLYSDMIEGVEKYELLAFSNAAQLEHALPAKFFEQFRKSKERIGITTRGIVPDTASDRSYNDKFFSGYKQEIIPRMRYIPADKFPFKGEITIYGGNKVAIVNLNKEYLTGIIIEDETIHKMLRLIFELSWNSNMVKP
jgi:sugar-specific transcriptional regulator TrmB